MTRSLTLAVDVDADATRVYELLSTTAGQQAFWTADCEVGADRARFGFPGASELAVTVTAEAGKVIRMHVTDGFPAWVGSTWEWELGPTVHAETGTGVLFRHHGFADGFGERDLGHVAYTWAMILDRLREAATGATRPYFPAAA